MRAFLIVFVSLAAGCDLPMVPNKADAGDPGVVPTGPGVGSPCMGDSACRDGLQCKAGTCQPGGNRIPGASCVLSAECLTGYYCNMLGKCAESGTSDEGGQCSTEGDCKSGLTCLLSGIYGTCAKPGNTDYDGTCLTQQECRGGLICSQNKCKTFLSITPWQGVQGCPVTEEAQGKIHFQIPRAGDAATEDFFRLPFPNDIRKKNGKVSFVGFPKPGARLLPFDPVDLYIRSIEEDGVGFGLNPTVYFRFSRDPSLGDGAGIHNEGAISFLDITPGAPGYGFRVGHYWSATTGGGRYLCPRVLMVRPPAWVPLQPGHTYAVVLTKAITDKDGNPMRRDADFTFMLQGSAPADPDLAAAWNAYAPFRKWIADKSPKVDDIVAAAVFTTDKVDEPVAKLRAAVRAGAAPEVKGLVKCGDGPSPCDDGKTRGCKELDPAASFDEYQGKITIPGFQKGNVPFELPTDGGGIEFGADGMPKVARTEEVCFSLTLPKGTPPATGWPVVVYSHGTGGNYRSIVELGLSEDLAKGKVDGGAAVPMAMFGYDGVLHGPRKGMSTKGTDELVFNYLNPRAARDNPLQAAADLFAIARLLEGGAVGSVKVDGKKMAFYGHSQGGNAGALAGGFEPAFGTIVLSGTGGGLTVGILQKKKPVSVAAALPVVLSDISVGETHPVMSLLQMFFERADNLNFARRIVNEPPMGVSPHHFLHIYGSDDTYAPDATQKYFGQAAGLQVLHPVVTGDDLKALVQPMTVPVKGNMNGVTAIQAQYKPGMYDGHFVSTQNPSARAALLRMLGTYFRDGTPSVE
jgi:hypothetical protein